MSRPQTLRIGPYQWRIAWSRKAVDAIHPMRDAVGGCDEQSLTIAVDPGKAEDFARSTLLHESLHACLRISEPDIDEEIEERFIAALSNPLLAMLRDNPQMVYYLTRQDV